jgi:polysaccharide transporter, PST family
MPKTTSPFFNLDAQSSFSDIYEMASRSFIVGLPYGPAGVALAFSVSGLFIRLPILYYIAGRRGPVNTADLWAVFFRHLPLWVVAFSATWLTRVSLESLAPLAQLFICATVGLLTAAVFICAFASQRKVAIQLFNALQELRNKR